MTKFRVGIDNYSIHPLGLTPLDMLKWANENGAEGISFSGLFPDELKIVDDAYLKDMRQFAAENNLYLEWGGAQHIPRELATWKKKDILAANKNAARQAEILGTHLVRSCSGGLMRWNSDSPLTETLLQETAQALREQRAMLRDHNVILAVETHFEFTTQELYKLFDMCDAEPGDCIGICLDTMNLLTMLEDPVMGTERILPWIVSTHIKDGGLLIDEKGLRSFTTEVGTGIVDYLKILKRLRTLAWDLNLNIEDHGGYFSLPIFDPLFLSKFPDLSVGELARLMQLTNKTSAKMTAGEIAILDRADWPAVCEARIKRDIVNLKQIRDTVNN